MKRSLLLGLVISIGCVAPKTTQRANYDFDFSHIRVIYQPPAPPYPPEAKALRIQGTVVVRLIVGPDGIPTSAEALQGPTELRSTAEAYALRWKFAPALLNGHPQYARFNMTMPFRLRTPPVVNK